MRRKCITDKPLRIHPRDVRVLDNLSTLRLIQSAYLLIEGRNEESYRAADDARKVANEAISYNPRDRFRHYRLAQALGLLERWAEAADIAGTILQWDGAVSAEQVERLQVAISERDPSIIAKEYLLNEA